MTFAKRILEYEREFVLQGFMRVVCYELPLVLQFFTAGTKQE
jgi:hypothetical protein